MITRKGQYIVLDTATWCWLNAIGMDVPHDEEGLISIYDVVDFLRDEYGYWIIPLPVPMNMCQVILVDSESFDKLREDMYYDLNEQTVYEAIGDAINYLVDNILVNKIKF